ESILFKKFHQAKKNRNSKHANHYRKNNEIIFISFPSIQHDKPPSFFIDTHFSIRQ
ncbi:conserved hypothetical protein, partial [Listeria monocytogenes FSL F2-208]